MNERKTGPEKRSGCLSGRRRTALLLGAAVVILLALPVGAQAGLRDAGAAGSAVESVDVVILADESGSMQGKDNEIQGEQQAATQIVQEEWSAQSQVAIYGFGSAPPGDPTQRAIDQYCGPTRLTGAGRARLSQCAGEIQPRTNPKEYNTDFAAALEQAKTVLGAAPPGSLPLVFILTDGKLDVGPDSAYAPKGLTPQQSELIGNKRAQADIADPASGILSQLRGIGAEVWPIGFGPADRTELSLFARGGAQNACPAGSGSVPAAAFVTPGDTGAKVTEDIQAKLLGAFADARCAVLQQVSWFPLPAGGSVTKTVDVSELATFGSLVVDKGDSRVVVTYTDPAGNSVSDNSGNGQPSGTFPKPDGTGYALSGGGQSALESLRLANPDPGPWTVTFTDPSGVPAQTVGLSVVWQGEVQLEFVGQTVADPGHSYLLAVQPTVRSKPVPAGAAGALTTSFSVTWPGGQAMTVTAKLDQASGDFVARPAVPPGANGTAQVTVAAASPGVQGQATTNFPVRPGGGLTVELTLPRGKVVYPGTDVTATATVTTNNSPATSIELSLGDLGDGVNAVINDPAGTVPVRSGRQTFPVTISFGSPNRLGPALGTIRWAPVTKGSTAPPVWLSFDSLDVNIDNAPTPAYEQPWPYGIVAAILLGVGAFCLLRWQRHRDDGYLQKESALPSSIYAPPGAGQTGDTKYGAPGGATPPAPGGQASKYQQPGGAANANQAAGNVRRALFGWRLPWNRQ